MSVSYKKTSERNTFIEDVYPHDSRMVYLRVIRYGYRWFRWLKVNVIVNLKVHICQRLFPDCTYLQTNISLLVGKYRPRHPVRKQWIQMENVWKSGYKSSFDLIHGKDIMQKLWYGSATTVSAVFVLNFKRYFSPSLNMYRSHDLSDKADTF